MDAFLDRLESQFSEFVSSISHFEPISDYPAKFERLDRELVTQVAELRRHYEACRRIEELKAEGMALDSKVNSILIEVAQFREELESAGPAASKKTTAVSSQDLLEYASKITRFTKQLPGSAEIGILPWPAEDQLRRGMLATLTIQEESLPAQMEVEAHTDEPVAASIASVASEASAVPPAAGLSGTNSSGDNPRGAGGAQAAPKPRPKPKISLDFDSDED